MQVAGDAVKELPAWAGPDVIIAATMSRLDGIVAAANAQAWCPSACSTAYQRRMILEHGFRQCIVSYTYYSVDKTCSSRTWWRRQWRAQQPR
jgi:hypothetical protein